MILLAILDIIYAVLTGLTQLVLPALPQSIDSILIYVLNMIDNGLDIVFTIFLDSSIVAPLMSFVLSMTLALFSLDLIWRIINIIKLSRDHQEPKD